MFLFVVVNRIDMAVSVSGGSSCKFWCLGQRVNPPNTPLFLQNPLPTRFTTVTTTTGWSRSSVVLWARDPKTGDQNSTASSQEEEEDTAYVAKLVVGSFAGAGAIKYGSALFPQITTPNLVLALVIISTPVLVSVFLLIKQSLSPKP